MKIPKSTQPRCVLLTLSTLLFLHVSRAAPPFPAEDSTLTPGQTSAARPGVPSGLEPLWGQGGGSSSFKTNSQNYEPAHDLLDDQLADDFPVPVGETWTVQQVYAEGGYFNGSTGTATSVNVTFYFDSGTLPGAEVPGGSFLNVAMQDTGGSFTIALPSGVVLTEGFYWISVQANMDFTAGKWGWRDLNFAFFSGAAWQNPGGGFGTTCFSWGRRQDCFFTPDPDESFVLFGTRIGGPTPTPTPTPSATPTPTPTPTPSPTSTPSPSATPTSTPSATPTATSTVTPSPTSTATPTPTSTATPTPTSTPSPPPAQALNISTRMRVDTGNNVLIGGFIVTGTAPKNVAVRGIGPSLAQFGIADVLADPTLELHDGSGALLVQNDNWQADQSQAAQLVALGLGLQDSTESGIVVSLPPSAYTAILAGKNGGTGVGLVEIYDTDPAANSQLANISTRGFVLTGNNVMIGGFILGGNNNTRIVARGIGPSLGQFGISPVLADPILELHDSNGALLVSNDNWQDDSISASQLTALGLAPQDPAEAGIYASLPPGAFSAVLAGKNNRTGIGLVEIYNVH